MVELNPHHPTTEKVHDHWHKIAALLLLRLGLRVGSGEVVIKVPEVDRLVGMGQCVVVINEKKDGIHLSIVTEEEARSLMRREIQ